MSSIFLLVGESWLLIESWRVCAVAVKVQGAQLVKRVVSGFFSPYFTAAPVVHW